MRLKFYSVVMALFFVLFGISLSEVQAAPFIRVTAAWRPASQLNTIDVDADGVTDAGDDIRYVTVDIYATVNVEFWAVGMVCTVNKAVLESYTQNGDPNGTEDNTAVFNKGAAWTSSINHSVNTIDTDGKINFAISMAGETASPLGSNGVEETLLIASLQYRVREDLLAAGNSPFTCTSNFLNRDGKKVLTATYVAPPNLNIIPGYSFTGIAKYQGIITVPTASQLIQVTCDDADGDTTFDDVVTSANATTGIFSANNLRTQGRYDCVFTPNILNNAVSPDAIHLTGQSDFYLNTASFAMMPVILKNGNMDTSAGSTNIITGTDLTMVTANWNAPASTLTLPYMFGDATGDKKINEMDLAIIAGNNNRTEPYPTQHIIYSFAQDNLATFNDHLWLGETNNATTVLFGSGTNRDYWPAVSPTGNRIAFVRDLGTNGNNQFAIFSAPITNGVMGAATRLTPANASYDAFAPSWSPDGSQIAFACSYDNAWSDLSVPFGYVCVMEAGGQNARVVNRNSGVPLRTKLQAIAWTSDVEFYVAYANDPATPDGCDDKLCRYNLTTFSLSVPTINAGADMPYVRETVLGPTLFYRFDDGAGNHNIRYAELISTGQIAGIYPNTTAGNIHEDVETGVFPTGTSIGSSIAYYTVSIGADPDILYYEYNMTTGDVGGIIWKTRFFSGTSSAPSWSTIVFPTYNLSNAISSPDFASGYNVAIPNTAVLLP